MKQRSMALMMAGAFFLATMRLSAQESTMCTHQDFDTNGGCTILGDPMCASTTVADTCFQGSLLPGEDTCGPLNCTMVCPGVPDTTVVMPDCCDAG